MNALITVTDYQRHGVLIRAMTADYVGRVIRFSRNLRGLTEYSRVDPVARVITRKCDQLPERGELTVIYASGAIARASFASFHIMIDYVRNRRTWRRAEFRHLDGNIGYLSKPGVVAGGLPS